MGLFFMGGDEGEFFVCFLRREGGEMKRGVFAAPFVVFAAPLEGFWGGG